MAAATCQCSEEGNDDKIHQTTITAARDGGAESMESSVILGVGYVMVTNVVRSWGHHSRQPRIYLQGYGL